MLVEKIQQVQADLQKLADETNGKNVSTSVNEMDGKKNFHLVLRASDGDGMLLFRCSSPRDFVAYLSFDEMVDSNGERRSPVRLKLDGGKPVSGWWLVTNDYKHVFAPSATHLANQIMAAEQLKFEHGEFKGPNRVATFTLAGLHEGLAKLESSCRIK
jgi:hypothetical protein